MLTVVERVLLLVQVDIFAETRSEDLAHVAAVASEDNFRPGEVVYLAGDPPEDLHVVIDGRIRLERDGGAALEATPGTAFGTWALFDTTPRLFTATAVEPTRVLSVSREAFIDVLSDHVRLAQGVLKVLADRLRRVVREHPDATDGRQGLAIG